MNVKDYKYSNYYSLKREIIDELKNKLKKANIDEAILPETLPFKDSKELLIDLNYHDFDIKKDLLFYKNDKIFPFELTSFLFNYNKDEIFAINKIKKIEEKIDKYHFPQYHVCEIHFNNFEYQNFLIDLINFIKRKNKLHLKYKSCNNSKPYLDLSQDIILIYNKEEIIIGHYGEFIKSKKKYLCLNIDRLAMIYGNLPDIRYFWAINNIKLDHQLNFHLPSMSKEYLLTKDKYYDFLKSMTFYRYNIANAIISNDNNNKVLIKVNFSNIENLLEISNLINLQLDKSLISKSELNNDIPVHIKILENKDVYLKSLKLRSEILKFYREFLEKNNFLEVYIPSISLSAFEGGSNVFEIDIFGKQAYLSQSNQLYLEIINNTLIDNSYSISKCFRAEKELPNKRLLEFTICEFFSKISGDINKLDAFCKWISFNKKLCFKLIDNLKKKFKINIKLPSSAKEIPSIKYREAIDLLKKENKEYGYLNYTSKITKVQDILLSKIVKDKYNSDIFFLTDFPIPLRTFYFYSENDITFSFDVMIRGWEVSSAAMTLSNWKNISNKDPFFHYKKSFDNNSFNIGSSYGIERLLVSLLEIDNIKDVSPFSIYNNKSLY